MAKIFTLFVSLLISLSAFSQVDYTQGVFFVNEDWYGHQNSSVNFLSSGGEWTYQVFSKNNPGKELGCTSQYGTIYGDKFYIVSKQEKDPGASILGSRLAVCDAKTMTCLAEFPIIGADSNGKSIADGRSFLGVNEKKGYIGTSNGIWIYNIEDMRIEGQIAGTENPNTDGYGQLYYAQTGAMLRVGDYVFALHQEDGLKVIDANTDKLIKTIPAPKYTKNGIEQQSGFGSIVQSKDGSLWLSMAANTMGMGDALSFITKLNPYTFEMETVQIPTDQGIEDIPNSWYAWTADGFCASFKENKIYWSGNNGGSWFKARRIFCYDIDNNAFSKVFDFETMPGDWSIYGAGFRLHPVTNEIYCSLFHDFLDQSYEVARINSTGNLLQEYSMITNYWFPAMPVFPDIYAPVVSNELTNLTVGAETKVYLGDKASDEDNLSVAIIKSIVSISDKNLLSAVIRNDSLIVTPMINKKGDSSIEIKFNSNGKIATKTIVVTVDTLTGIDVVTTNDDIYFDALTGNVVVNASDRGVVNIYTITGQSVLKVDVTAGENYINTSDLSQGVYITRIGAKSLKFIKK